jgi:Flp pilus assembly protein TadG
MNSGLGLDDRTRNTGESGFTLIATAVCLIVLVGMLGLAVDLGRVYVTKNEAQAFTDAAALAATRCLNGKSTGITAANAAVTTTMSSNRWNMATTAFTSDNTTTEFGMSAAGPWSANPSPATSYAYTRVTATPSLGMSFIRVVGGPSAQSVTAQSVAGMVAATFPSGGYLPFTVFAHTLTGDPNYGFTVGEEYTFLWPGNVKLGSNSCHGDNSQQWINNANAGGGSDRGYFELQAAVSIREAILGQRQLSALSVGDILNLTNGQKQTEQDALTALAARDTDQTDYHANSNGTAPTYYGNGVRVVLMPINSGFTGDPSATPPIQPQQVLTFGAFLLPTSFDNGGNKSWCAIYMGSKSVGSDGVSPLPGAGAYVTKLVQ